MISALHEIEAVCFNPLLIPWDQLTHPSLFPLPFDPYTFLRLLRRLDNFSLSVLISK